MKNFKGLFLSFLFYNLLIFSSLAQYPKNFYRPLNLPLKITGNFAEIRKNHFHTGIDLSVNRKIGIPIYNIADGYVSRIKVSATGYGRAVYITHYNGYKSVYAHLSRFSNKIQSYITEIQRQTESFQVDVYLPPDKIKVRKGEIIGYSGNSGYSFGAHLHFEIRDTNDVPYNPELFNFRTKDTKKPIIKRIVIYPATDTSLVNFKLKPLVKKIQVVNGKYHLNPPIVVYGAFYLGIETYDYNNLSGSPNQIYKLNLYVDDTLIFSYHFQKIPFELKRAINSFIDYKLYLKKGLKIQRCYLEPNNKLPIYDSVKNSGILVFHDNDFHIAKFEIFDIYGNKRVFDFQIKSTTKMGKYKIRKYLPDTVFRVNLFYDNRLKIDSFEFVIPKNALFSETALVYKKYFDTTIHKTIYRFGDFYIPVFKPFTIRVKVKNLPLAQKYVVVYKNYKSETEALETRYWKDNIYATSYQFGDFYVDIDTTPPTIEPVYDYSNKTLKKTKILKFKIQDDLSGIMNYYGFINGKWALFQYDKKSNLLYYKFDNNIRKGKNTVFIGVYDKKWNFAWLEFSFFVE